MVIKKPKNKKIFIGIFMIVIILFTIIFSEVLAPNNPNLNNLSHRFEKSSNKYPLGTDQFGRCILSRLIFGGYNTFSVVIIVIIFSAVIGITLGVISGYYGGLIDRILSGLFDIFMSFPPFIYVMALIGVMGGSKTTLTVALILGSWAYSTKTIRTQVQIENNKLYIKSARIAGSSNFSIITKHILPSIMPNIIIFFSLQLGGLILEVSAFSFLGVGLGGNVPEWGMMISTAKEYILTNKQLMIYPGLCIFFTVFAFNILAEGIREIYQI